MIQQGSLSPFADKPNRTVALGARDDPPRSLNSRARRWVLRKWRALFVT